MLEVRNLKRVVELPGGHKTTILRLEELTVRQGECVAITGASGSGKTTLLHLIAGLIRPTEGSIAFAGCRVDGLTERVRDKWRAATIGYIFQKFNLLDGLTVLENVLIPGYFARRDDQMELRRSAMALLAQVGLVEKMGEKPHHLSIGEQQRVAVARALLLHPSLILADEPTASLDEVNAASVTSLLTRLCEENGSMLLLSTHDVRVARHFSRCLDLCGKGAIV